MTKDKNAQSIKFRAQRITYSTPDGFKIIVGKAFSPDTNQLITKCSIKGSLLTVEEHDDIFATGTWGKSSYGIDFKVEGYAKVLPRDAESILAFLEQGNIKGINKKTAKLIVKRFGDNTLNVLVTNPQSLLEIKGIGQATIEKIKKSAKEKIEEDEMVTTIMSYIQDFGISPAYAKRIYNRYGVKSMSVIKDNPYKLADDIRGIGFLKADEIALNNNIPKDSPLRIRSAIEYVIKQMNEDGHVFGYVDDVKAKSWELLQVDVQLIEAVLDKLADGINGNLVYEDDALYSRKLYFAEQESARILNEMLRKKTSKNFDVTDDEIKFFGMTSHMTYEGKQKEAIQTACKKNISILTGGPGTGKTTTVNAIIHFLKVRGLNVLCAAPTGKAAKRMSEATGESATTIHKLLQAVNDEVYGFKFKKDEYDKIEGDALIIDESSMIDMQLLYYILRAVPEDMKLIFVGDIDQLPSVGCGNVLGELIASKKIPLVRLSFIFRQGQESMIKANSHLINEGIMPDFKNRKDGDFFFIDVNNWEPEQIRDKIVDYVCNNLPSYYENLTVDDIQVLAPMKKGPTGVYELNKKIQERLTGGKNKKREIPYSDCVFRVGDKVMYTRNDYDKDVVNGDVGYIISIHNNDDENADNNSTFKVDFGDNKIVQFEFKDSADFVLAYAMTIHKSQGSEYPVVIMPLTYANYIMLQRNLLYTGITRAKKIFVLFGQKRAIATAIKNHDAVNRNTRLAERIRGEK